MFSKFATTNPRRMPEPIRAATYFLFMKWLKEKHPRLFGLYSLHIIVPTETDQIHASMDYVDPADKDALQLAIDEYYTTVAD